MNATVISDTEARDNLAANLHCILQVRGLTQQQVATATSRPLMLINNAFNGRNRPGAALVLCLGEAFGYTSEELLGPREIVAIRERLRSTRKSSLIPA